MGFFSGGSTTSTSDSFSGLRNTKQFKPLVKQLGSGFETGMNFAKNRLQDTNPFQLNASTGLTAPQQAAFNTLGQNLFSNVSSNFAGRGFLSPENVGGVIGSSLQQAAPQLLGQVFQNQVANEGAVGDRFAALRGLLDTGTGLAGSEQHSTSVTKGPNLLAGNIAKFASPEGLKTVMDSAGQAAALFCWVAESLYGVDAPKTHLARWYVNHVLPFSAWGRAFRKVYGVFGRAVAARIPKSRFLRIVLTPIFDTFATRAAKLLVR